jgi:hypothetical protein
MAVHEQHLRDAAAEDIVEGSRWYPSREARFARLATQSYHDPPRAEAWPREVSGPAACAQSIRRLQQTADSTEHERAIGQPIRTSGGSWRLQQDDIPRCSPAASLRYGTGVDSVPPADRTRLLTRSWSLASAISAHRVACSRALYRSSHSSETALDWRWCRHAPSGNNGSGVCTSR